MRQNSRAGVRNLALAVLCTGMLICTCVSARADQGTDNKATVVQPASTPSAEVQPAKSQENKTAAQPAAAETSAKAAETPATQPKSDVSPAPFEGIVGPKGAKYVGTETCESCHDKEAKEFKLSTHGRIGIQNEDVSRQGCEMCHGPGSVHVENNGGKGNIINPKKDPTICFTCHMDKKAQFRLPYHHPVLEGHMGCTDCHSAHGEEIKPWTATTMKDVNEACFRCHKDQRGPFVWEHEALREGCPTCHSVHGSVNEKMLVVRDSNLCLRCHAQVNFPVIGSSSHSGRLFMGPCFSGGCHTAVHGSQFSAHLRY